MLRLTIPTIVGLISMVALGLMDTYFVSMLGTNELAAVSFSQPVTNIYIGVALGIGMSLAALVSRLIGQNHYHKAARLITDTNIVSAVIAVCLAIVGILIIEPLFRVLGATDEVIPFIQSYMNIWFLASPMWMLTIITNSAFRAIGDTKLSAAVMMLLAMLNLIFDPLLIFGVGPFPKLGVAGAAWATFIACAVTWVCTMLVLAFREKLLDMSRPKRAHLLSNMRELSNIAIPAVAANLMTPVAAAILTAIIARFGVEAVAGFGVGSRIEFLCIIVVLALSSTLPLVIGQNIGARKPDRVYRALMGSLKFALIFQAAVYIALLLCSGLIASAFSDNPQVIQVIKIFLWILPLTYGAHGVVILIMVSLNVLGRPRAAFYITVIRLAMLYLPLAYIGSLLGGVTGAFIGAACGNLIAGLVSFSILKKVLRVQSIGAETV